MNILCAVKFLKLFQNGMMVVDGFFNS